MKLTALPHLVLRLRMSGAIPHLHGMQRNNTTCLYKITQQEVVEDEGNSGPGQPPLTELMVCLRKCEKQSKAISKNRLTAATCCSISQHTIKSTESLLSYLQQLLVKLTT